jgi:DUF4097 and DUF4098 domain-containing protein YvlB
MKAFAGSSAIRAILLLAAVVQTACTAEFGDRVREQFHQAVPTSGTPAVHVDNIAGSVRISAWAKPSVDVQATKYGSDADQLRGITIDVRGEGNGVFVTTRYSGAERRGGGVRYTISVPTGASLRITSVAGLVDVSGVSGDVTVQAQAGAITANVGKVEGERSIDLSATAGAIALSIAPGSNASVDARSIVGAFASEIPGLEQSRENLVGARASGKIGSGTARIRLSTTTGAIALRERS